MRAATTTPPMRWVGLVLFPRSVIGTYSLSGRSRALSRAPLNRALKALSPKQVFPWQLSTRSGYSRTING
jgi:hypothetical protein